MNRESKALVEGYAVGRVNVDIYRQRAAKVFQVPMESVTDQQRTIGKTLLLVEAYGLSDAPGVRLICEQYREYLNV